jgi:hypothetical protein
MAVPPQLRRLVAGFPPRRPGFNLGPGHVGFVVDKVALGQVFSEYFSFLCQLAFHRLLHNHHHRHHYYHLSSGAGTVGQKMAAVQNGLSITPMRKSKKKKIIKTNRLVTLNNTTQSIIIKIFSKASSSLLCFYCTE